MAGIFSSLAHAAFWMAVFLVHAPRDASLDLEARNGPIEVRGVNGSVKLRATNGPIAIAQCGGSVEAHTTNGPISFSGDRGEGFGDVGFGRSGENRDAAAGFVAGDAHDAAALFLVEAGELAGGAVGVEAVHTANDQPGDEAAELGLVNLPARVERDERGRENAPEFLRHEEVFTSLTVGGR